MKNPLRPILVTALGFLVFAVALTVIAGASYLVGRMMTPFCLGTAAAHDSIFDIVFCGALHIFLFGCVGGLFLLLCHTLGSSILDWFSGKETDRDSYYR